MSSPSPQLSTDAILSGQREVLAMIARGAPLRQVLDAIARYSELCTPEMLASILFYEPASGALRRGGHHRLPDSFADTVDGLVPGPSAGSCGTAAFRRDRVVSFDVQLDPLWAAFKEFAAQHGIRSAWSTPLVSSVDGSLLGVFGMYYPDTREPSAADLALVDHFTHLAAIAIERQRRDDALRESERLRHQALVATVAGVAHELNTPIGVALTAEGLLGEDVAEAIAAVGPDVAGRIERSSRLIRANLERAAGLVRAFKAVVADQTSDEARELELHAYVRDVLTTLEPLTAAHGLAVSLGDATDARVRCVPGRVAQVVTNLVQNAAQHAYGPEGGALRIELSTGPDRVTLVVSDLGRGMSDEVRQRCVEPFFTTNREHGGTGLGLFVVKRIVESELGGRLALESGPGIGTRWTIQLPSLAPAS